MAMQDLVAWVLVVAVCGSASAAVLPGDGPEMAVKVESGAYTAAGHRVKVAATAQLPIASQERIRITAEPVVIGDERPNAYQGGTVLAKTMGPVDIFTRYPYAIDPTSVKVRSASDGGDVYEEGKDYFLDHDWGGMARIDGGRIAKGATVYVDYAILLQRIDVVQVSAKGVALVKQGESVVANAETPIPDPGCTAIAAVYVPMRIGSITGSDIYALPSTKATWRDFIKVSGREHLANTLGLLNSRKPVTVVCWGDSVTQGGSPLKHEGCYVERFRASLKAAYPQTPITLINAGIGGTNTEGRRSGFEAEVLAHKPDLITVEFVNDVGFGPDKIKANWAEFIEKARKANPRVELILITPHFMTASWMGAFEKSVDAMREAARTNKVALADATNIWAHLREVAIPYETLLANGINHPNDLGHEFFSESLMRLMAPRKRH